jgi:cell division protein FtsI/penicillin-binding protein 2
VKRREALAVLSGAFALCPLSADDSPAIGIVLDIDTGQIQLARRREAATNVLAAPGSALKPLVLAAMTETGSLRVAEKVACSGKLTLAGRSYACVHPKLGLQVDLPAAIAYSCNEYVAHVTGRLGAGEVANILRKYGLSSRTQLGGPGEAAGRVSSASGVESQLQALGGSGVEITVLGLASAYRKLALQAPEPILVGMEGAVEFGTAQRAAIPTVRVAGKTGSAAGGRWAWFAGFAPSRKPKFAVAVLTQGASGGADAAPLGGELLRSALGVKA